MRARGRAFLCETRAAVKHPTLHPWSDRALAKQILQIGYYRNLLQTRAMMLEASGYRVAVAAR